jgi:hypothetical protein
MTTDPMPDWLCPPPRGFTGDDLDRLPGLPPHTQLIDGSLVFASPRTAFHALTVDLLRTGPSRCALGSMRVRRKMTVTLDDRQHPDRMSSSSARPATWTRRPTRPRTSS